MYVIILVPIMRGEKMKVGLFGFTMAHENMGCQALTCSFLELLRNNCKKREITIVDFGMRKRLVK